LDDDPDVVTLMQPGRTVPPVLGRKLVIGDVHGHYDTLLRLLDLLAIVADDRVDFLGDLIDRGPRSRDTVELVRTTPHFYTIRGNHEELAIAACGQKTHNDHALESWLRSGGRSTIESYEDRRELVEHIAWLREQPLYRDRGDYWLVHAGLDPKRSIAEQTAREFCWIRDPFHRSATPYFNDKLTIIGHTISFTFLGVKPGQLARGSGWIDIDTGAYTLESGWLTAIDLSQRRVYQANVWTRKTRVLDWEDAIVDIDPLRVHPRRFIVK
jgi:serine/threonine protein phosphatase 1